MASMASFLDSNFVPPRNLPTPNPYFLRPEYFDLLDFNRKDGVCGGIAFLSSMRLPMNLALAEEYQSEYASCGIADSVLTNIYQHRYVSNKMALGDVIPLNSWKIFTEEFFEIMPTRTYNLHAKQLVDFIFDNMDGKWVNENGERNPPASSFRIGFKWCQKHPSKPNNLQIACHTVSVVLSDKVQVFDPNIPFVRSLSDVTNTYRNQPSWLPEMLPWSFWISYVMPIYPENATNNHLLSYKKVRPPRYEDDVIDLTEDVPFIQVGSEIDLTGSGKKKKYRR
jgi:hypothetical protein